MVYQLTIDDLIGRWGYSKQYVRNVLGAYKGKHVDVKISSYGGDLDHGLDIRQQFIDHGDVTVHLSGFVASSATVIAMGAKRICMSKYAMFLVHKCSNFIDAWGSYNADQMQALIEDLEKNKKENDKIDVVLANMYAAKCKKPVSDILDILKEGRWLNAQEAYDYGFIDEITENADEPKQNFTAEIAAKMNAFGLSTVGLPSLDNPEDKKSGLINRLVSAIFGKETTEEPAEANTPNNSTSETQMKKFNFATVAALLKLDSISADKDGDVTLTAEQLEQINNHIDELTASADENKTKLDESQAKVDELTKQVDALKKNPGDTTTDIKDEAGDEKLNASDMFNAVKNLI
jgi:ATP-dependent protease ClpP protease subunit